MAKFKEIEENRRNSHKEHKGREDHKEELRGFCPLSCLETHA
jgi:hypothetical protein